MESSTARMDNHRTDHHVLHLSICLELIRTITIQSIPFDTRFYLFIQNKVIRYTSALIAIPFLYLLLPGNCLLLLYLYGIVFERIFLQTKRLPYVTGYKSGTCCRMASVMAKLCFYTPVNQLYTFINPEYGMRYIYVYYALFLIPLCSVFLSGRKKTAISLSHSPSLNRIQLLQHLFFPNREREKRLAVQRYAEEQQWDRVLQTIHTSNSSEAYYHPYLMLALNEKVSCRSNSSTIQYSQQTAFIFRQTDWAEPILTTFSPMLSD